MGEQYKFRKPGCGQVSTMGRRKCGKNQEKAHTQSSKADFAEHAPPRATPLCPILEPRGPDVPETC